MGQLSRAVADRRHAFHTPTLATIGADGAPDLRTLVLRGFERDARALRFHTDQRAAKFTQIAADPRVSLHGYDPGHALQLRLSGVAYLHHQDDIAARAWAASQAMSRRCYAITPAPGTPIDAPPAAPEDDMAGQAHFAVLRVVFHRLECLWLHVDGHRRAVFSWESDGALHARWLVP